MHIQCWHSILDARVESFVGRHAGAQHRYYLRYMSKRLKFLIFHSLADHNALGMLSLNERA